MSDRRVAKSWRITDHGVEHSQYFPGHGIALTRWQDCATGYGSTPAEAFADALDILSDEWEIDVIEKSPESEALCANESDAHEGCVEGYCSDLQSGLFPKLFDQPFSDWHENCELYHIISIDASEEEL